MAIFKDYASICLEKQFNPMSYNNGKTNYSSIKHNNIFINLEISYMYTLWLMIKPSTSCCKNQTAKFTTKKTLIPNSPCLELEWNPVYLKHKAIPSQAWRDSYSSGTLRLPEFTDN